MEKDKLEKLLDSIYELEGLVHLALAREDVPDVLPELIARKGKELASLTIAVAGEKTMKDNRDYIEEHIEETEEIITEPDTTTESEDLCEMSEVISEDKPLIDEPRKTTEPGGRLVFSINDRYRFRRELFENSDADFNTTLALVASMESYEEAEDYFTNEREWDPAVPAVADFLEVIRKYFG